MATRDNQASEQQLPLYRPAGFYMLRAPTLPLHTFKHITTHEYQFRHGDQQELEDYLTKIRNHTYDVLKALIADKNIQLAFMVASIDMMEGLQRLQQEDVPRRRLERIYSSILRYLVRMSTRATPFGLFSGVAVGTLAEQTRVQLGTPIVRNIRTRPDMGWLYSIIQQLEEDAALVPHLRVIANKTAYIAGARMIIPYADVFGKGDHRSIALRATEVVQYVLHKAQTPIPYHCLQQETLAAFPFATEQQVNGLLQQLWQHHFLMSDLRPPLTSPQPEKYFLERVQAIPQEETLAATLEEVINGEKSINPMEPDVALSHLRHLLSLQQTLVPEQKQQPLQVDAALHLESPQLSQDIGVAVADATETLLRITSLPNGTQHLREYARLFIDRYGLHAEVPLLDLLSEEMGLGAPSTYMEPPRDFQRPPLTASEKQGANSLLYSLFAEALYQHKMEVELTDELVQSLTRWTPEFENSPPATVEMYLQIHATSREAINEGNWRGVVASMAYGGRTFCRFFDIVGDEGLSMLQEYAKQEEKTLPDSIFAELSYLPTFGRGANVAIRPLLRSYEIAVNTTPSVPPEYVIPLHDLVVGMKGDYFYIRSLTLQKKVIVTQSHMLNIQRAPNICRFLIEASQDGGPQPMLFSWKALAGAPFLPRVVRKKMVLSPAQWNVHLSMFTLTGKGSQEAQFFAAVQQWRRQWHVPRYVYLTQFDHRLLLDLEHPLLIAELYDELKKGKGILTLQEMLPDFEHMWLCDREKRHYIAELVVPLLRNEPSKEATKHESEQKVSPHYPLSSHERCFLPGDQWTFLKLYVVSKQQDEIISGPLRQIAQEMQGQQLIDKWFFIRYADPEPHLRVRFHARNEHARNAVLIQALTWGRQLADAGLIRDVELSTYARETERYGGPQTIEAMEQVFTVNSVATAEIVAALYRKEITLDPLAVTVFTLDHFFMLWGLDLPARLTYIQKHTGKYDWKEEFREKRQFYCELLLPWEHDHDPTLSTQRELLQRYSLLQKPVLEHVSSSIETLKTQGALWVQQAQILASLAHMHSNRMLGITQAEEHKAYAFWRHTLESLQRRLTHKREGKHGNAKGA